jgi:hypothetical protein
LRHFAAPWNMLPKIHDFCSHNTNSGVYERRVNMLAQAPRQGQLKTPEAAYFCSSCLGVEA